MSIQQRYVGFILGCFLGGLVLCHGTYAAQGPAWHQDAEALTHEGYAHELSRHRYTNTEQKMSGSVGAPVMLCQVAEPVGMEEDSEMWGDEGASIPDPLEPLNRVFFQFNDKLYFWVLKPVSQGYAQVVPEPARVSIRNFFSNLVMPIRAVSCLLQGKIEGMGIEVLRFAVNTTAGFAGFQDVARQHLDLPLQDEDLGQAFAFWGIGPGFYIDLPFLGPSSLRGAVGWAGQLYLNPLDYMVKDVWANIGVRGYDVVNKSSLRIGEYESFKRAALDPYVALRDAYYQYRIHQIEK
ncbi:MAG: VacJ family lipoprotein [Desulfatiglandaceae bacterium]